MDRIARGCDTHIFARTTPCDCPNISIFQTRGPQNLFFNFFDFIHRPRHFEINQLGRFVQPLGMFAAFENFAVVGALALKHAVLIVHRMGQNMDLGIAPAGHDPVHPDGSFAVIICA
jgi:hypothetical protein